MNKLKLSLKIEKYFVQTFEIINKIEMLSYPIKLMTRMINGPKSIVLIF